MDETYTAGDYDITDPDNYFIGTLRPIKTLLDVNGAYLRVYEGQESSLSVNPDDQIDLMLRLNDTALLHKISGRTTNEEGDVDFKQKFALFRNDQEIEQFRAVPISIEGGNKVNMFFP